MKLLVIDESDAIRRAIVRTLEEPGDHIEMARDGHEALAMLRSFEADVVTMDISMPEMDGLRCLADILRLRPHARVLVVSSRTDKDVAVQAVANGAAGYLLKPFTTAALCFEIGDLLAD